MRLYKAVILAYLNWAATKKVKGGGGLIAHNPLRGRLVLPEGGSRVWRRSSGRRPSTSKSFNMLIPAFANVVRILRWTGCRPSLVCRIEAKHYNATTKTWDVKDLYPDKPGSKSARRGSGYPRRPKSLS